MKKLLIIVWMLIYGLSSSGMTISLHYCCGKLDGISLSGKQGSSCKMGNFVKKMGCCDDKQISASLSSEQQTAFNWVQLTKDAIAQPAQFSTNTSFRGYIVADDKLARGTPDLPSSIPLFIKHCVFRI